MIFLRGLLKAEMGRVAQRGAVILLLLSLCWLGHAQAGWKTPRETLDRRLASADFHIYYTLEGEHAFAADVPPGQRRETEARARLVALIEQLQRADRVYREKLSLRPPFASGRHATGLGIDIHILKLDGKSGSTGDELHRFDYRHFPARTGVIAIALSNRWRPTSLTPAHELFHAYQYSYTFFKNAWYLEGMARASENFFRLTQTVTVRLPDSLDELGTLLRESYEASRVWNRIIELCGPGVLAPLLESYDRLDGAAANARNIVPTDWPEDEQWAEANNAFLFRGLHDTLVAPHCSSAASTEIGAFRALLGAWLSN